jgi:hypothetical protein
MHAWQDEQRAGRGRRHRGDEHGVAAVVQILDDEAGRERLLHLHQRRPECALDLVAGDTFRQAAYQRITRDLLEHRALEHILGASPGAGADHDPRHEADGEHYQDGDDPPELPAGRERRRDRRQQREDAGERLANSRMDR